jgi:hypothetical protein
MTGKQLVKKCTAMEVEVHYVTTIYNHLPQHLKKSGQNVKHFVAALKRFLYHHSFYAISEYLEYKEPK